MEKLYLPLPVNSTSLSSLVDRQRMYEVLVVCCKLEIFSSLSQAKTVERLAQESDFDLLTTTYLLSLLAKAGYLTKDGDAYCNTPLAENYLKQSSFLNLIHFFPDNFPADSLGEQLLTAIEKKDSKAASPEPKWNPDRLRQIGVGALIGSLHTTVKACDLTGVKRILDLGGGHGFYSIAFAQKYPNLEGTLFDLPQVLPLAKDFIEKFELEDRIELKAGNFLEDDLGQGYDAVLCSNILHSDKRDVVLPKVWKALESDGRIIVKCRVKDCEDNFPNALEKLLWYVRGGKELFSQEEWKEFLTSYGFNRIETVDLNGIFATFIGWKK